MFKRKRTYTDREILDGLRRSDNNVLSYLYAEYINIARSIVNKYPGYDIDVEELLQLSMVIFYEKIIEPSFILTAKLSTFFYPFCLNKCREMIKEKRKNRTNEITQEDDVSDEKIGTSEMEEWLAKYGIEGMRNCLENLKEKRKNIIIDYYYGRLKMAEIAKKENLTNAEHAKVEKSRAIADLKKCMGI